MFEQLFNSLHDTTIQLVLKGKEGKEFGSCNWKINFLNQFLHLRTHLPQFRKNHRLTLLKVYLHVPQFCEVYLNKRIIIRNERILAYIYHESTIHFYFNLRIFRKNWHLLRNEVIFINWKKRNEMKLEVTRRKNNRMAEAVPL